VKARLTALFLMALLLVLAVAILLAHAQAPPAKRVPRVAILGLQPRALGLPFIQALEEGLRELGHEPGRSIIVEYYTAEGQIDRLPAIAAEIVRQRADVIVTSTNETTHAAKLATTTVPIVMGLSGDPVGQGFIDSLARPGGNITGLTFDAAPGAFAKPLEFLKEAMPGATAVAVLQSPDPLWQATAKLANDMAGKLGLALTFIEISGIDDFAPALAAVKRSRFSAVLVWPNPVIFAARAHLLHLAAKDRIPVASIVRQFADDGALLSYGPSVLALFRRTAFHVDKILNGVKPGDLPVEQPTTFELVINLRTARALGLSIPPALRLRADHLIDSAPGTVPP
jgi:putative ABC transport system substrate-binding protein